MPLATQQAQQFGLGPVNIEVSQPNGDKAAIPQPLVRIQFAGGHGIAAAVIVLQNGSHVSQQCLVVTHMIISIAPFART